MIELPQNIITSFPGIEKNISLKDRTTLRTGGPAAWYLRSSNEQEVIDLYQAVHSADLPVYILGKGSNLIINDEGLDAIVIQPDIIKMSAEPEKGLVHLGSGVSVSTALRFIHEHNLAGFEFAAGIPGTIGGAVKMNAGTTSGCIADVIISARTLDENGPHDRQFDADHFSYRNSPIRDIEVILSADFQFHQVNPEEMEECRQKCHRYIERRNNTQPLDKPNFGSTFKNPEGGHAAKLIEECGLKGRTVGGIQVSQKHANFLVNLGKGTSADAMELIDIIRAEVKKQRGVKLELEVRLWGF